MQTKDPISCPIDGTTVNENVVRTVAIFVFLIAGISILFNFYFITLFLVFDFTFRAFFDGKFSLLKMLASETNKALKIKLKPTDSAPKKFAALLGFIFVNVIFVLQCFGFLHIALIIGILLLVCAFLEGVLGYCVGCVVYQLIQKFK